MIISIVIATMSKVNRVCNVFLWCMSGIYLIAFASLYVQIPGLYGNNGILPARNMIERGLTSIRRLLTSNQPSLVRLFPMLGLNTETMLDLVCVAGVLLSSLSLVFASLRCTVVYILLWWLYFSIYLLGETFLWFQWDILLLEIGVLTAIVAPILPGYSHTQHNGISLWLTKWLLFRLMFASGVVKLQSHCPTWWGLTALQWHFESQCIPTPLAYYMHHLPRSLLRLGVVQTYVTQVGLSFLFFSPLRSLRVFVFWAHVVHQVLILLTGNYNFFNLLAIVLAFSLLDDSHFTSAPRASNPLFVRCLDKVIQAVVCLIVLYFSVKYFSLKLNDDWSISSDIAFSQEDFSKWVRAVVPMTIWLAVVSLGYEILIALCRSLTEPLGAIPRLLSSAQCVLYAIIAIAMFAISLVPHTVVDRATQEKLPQTVHSLHASVRHLQVTSSYGLFRSMTGVGGRPEVIIEGSHDPREGWKAYDFLYKPGNLSTPPPFVAPHQPRLDWQMWFAALGSYHHNPWFLNFVYRLLTNQKEVLALIHRNPFPEAPPTYIRAVLCHYHYTDWTPESRSNWWRREDKKIYLPAISKDDVNFVQYLREAKIIGGTKPRVATGLLVPLLQFCRYVTQGVDAFIFILGLFIASASPKIALLWRHLATPQF